MSDFWQKIFEQVPEHHVFFKEIFGRYEWGTECVIQATDNSFETGAIFVDGIDGITERDCPHKQGCVKLVFKCDYEYMFPAVFKDDAELKAHGITKRPINVIIGQDADGSDGPMGTAILCGKITAIKEFEGAHIFEVEYGDKTFLVVFTCEIPEANVGDILYGEFDVLASLLSTC